MTDRPINMSTDQVQALLAGKTQHRVVLEPQPSSVDEHGRWYRLPSGGESLGSGYSLPHAIGDRLWVREAFCKAGDHDDDIHACPDMSRHAYYAADAICPDQMKWRSSATMPRWASRLTLVVTDVQVQRLQEISEADAFAEGCEGWHTNLGHGDFETEFPRDHFMDKWDKQHKRTEHQWEANPWVCALTFRVIHQNIDEVKT